MNSKVDLHIHTYASDGAWTAKELVAHIDEKEIKMFAVCDHDEVRCVPEIVEVIEGRTDLTFIKAVEISVQYEGEECHLLTYGIDENDPELMKILKHNQSIREDYNDRLIEFLSLRYQGISLEDYYNYEYNPYQGGWKALVYLIERGVVENIGQYFDVIEDFNYEKIFDAADVMIPKLKALGYTVILAHPPYYTTDDFYSYEALDDWRNKGIEGLECYTQYLEDKRNASYYVNYCARHNLMITGGSDCHGGFAGRELGKPDVRKSMIRLSTVDNQI